MALHYLNAILFLQFLIILSVADFHQTQNILNYSSTAKLPTSWTINPAKFGRDQVFLFNPKPNSSLGIGFGCGFYSDIYSEGSFYFAVGIVSTFAYFGEFEVLNFKNTLWLANRNRPVGKDATLQLKKDGNLELRDFDGSLVWSTNTSNKASIVAMKMMETGNLVLYDKDNTTIWQSFDHPTDILMIGQKLVEGQKLVSSVSQRNMSEGNYHLSVTSQGISAYYQADVLIPLSYVTYLEVNSSLVLTYIEYDLNLTIYFGDLPYIIFSSPTDYSLMSYIKLDPDGHFTIYGDGSESYYIPYDMGYVCTNGVCPVSSRILEECYYPTSCGDYGVCSNNSCSCLPGFVKNEVENPLGKLGCSRTDPNMCKNTSSQSLFTSEDGYYYDAYGSKTMKTDKEGCKQACLKNCSCTVALFQQAYKGAREGDCIFPNPTLSLTRYEYGQWSFFSYLTYSYALVFIKESNADPIPGEGGMPSPKKSSRKQITIIGLTVGILLPLIVGFSWIIFVRKKGDANDVTEDDLDELPGMPTRFTYEELKTATEDFQIRLGGGGFGSVYEGNMVLVGKIAVKRLDALGQGKKEFLAEVKSIGSIHHNNLVRLVGFCTEKMQRLLVYEFMCNGSLDKWIFPTDPLRRLFDWETRKKIIFDVAKGLCYLHEDCRQRIVHLDIKPQNILLDADLSAKISDFGLAKLIEKDQSQVVTTLRGTPGYMAPELFSSVVTEKADVYSFGIVFMEVVCGSRNLDRNQPEECMHLLPIFMKKAEERQLIDMVDKNSEDMQFHKLEVAEMMKIAIWCLQFEYTRRPSMAMVVKVLEGTMEVETDLNYTVQNPTPMAVPSMRRDGQVAVSAPLFPSVLSAPR